MTKATFFTENGAVCGFHLEGHSTKDAGDGEGKLLCAAVSSAAYMAANTVTDIIGDKADIKVQDGDMYLKVYSPTEETKAILNGLKLHLSQLSKQYGKRLTITEV